MEKSQGSSLPAFMDYHGLSASCGVTLHQFRSGQIVHAYLLTGARGLGKRTFAEVLASALFCTSEIKPCGVCESCRRVLDHNEPDVLTLYADDGKQIGVDRVREIIRAVSQHSFGTGYRVVLIEPVDKLTPQAQNCLLKSLEEPVAKVVFLLMTHELTATLGTIASRCVRVKLSPWPDEQLRQTLEKRGYAPERIDTVLGLCGGNIGAAIDLLSDEKGDAEAEAFVREALDLHGDAAVLSVSTRLKDKREDAERYLTALEQALHQTLLVQAGLLTPSALAAYPVAWQNNAINAPTQEINKLMDAVFTARKRRLGQVNWQSTVDHLMMTLLEEQQVWQQS
ncbi:MAG: DNA polymerase III subunit [Eubacteriales bacterium]|nr:DNA polymerase III subunit [Eubacteriales bacterium]